MSKTTDQNPLNEAPDVMDVLDIVDVSDTTDSPEGSSFKITVGYLLLAAGLKRVRGYEGYVITAATGNNNPLIVQENDVLIGKGAYNDGKYSMLRALQDEPSLDEHFAIGFNSEEF